MRAILINPYIRTIEEIIVKRGDISSIYNAMSWLGHRVEIVQVGMVLPNGDNLLVDEGAALKPGRKVWKLNGIATVGCGLFLGSTKEEWCGPRILIEDLYAYVSWTNITSIGEINGND